MHNLKPNHSWRYWWNELLLGGNYPIYIKESKKQTTMIRTHKKLQEKFIVSLRERLRFKKSKEQELESTLIRISRESRYAYEDLKDCISELKKEVGSDETDSDQKVESRKWQKLFKKINRISLISDVQSDSD